MKQHMIVSRTLLSITNKHIPLKTNMNRRNQAPFMTEELSKQIMIKSRLRNKFNKHRTREHWENYTRQRNKCTSLPRKTIKEHFSKLCENGVIRKANFWSSIKPFMSNKGCHNSSSLNILEDGVIISDELKVAMTSMSTLYKIFPVKITLQCLQSIVLNLMKVTM